MRNINVVLIVGITTIFLFLNIYGLIEILRFLRDIQLLRSKNIHSTKLTEDVTPHSVRSEPSTTTATSIRFRVKTTTPSKPTISRLYVSRITPPRTTSSRATSLRVTPSRTTPSRATPSRSTISWFTNRVTPSSSTHRHPKLHGHQRVNVGDHPQRHHHTPIHRVHPHISLKTTTPSTTSTRIHITTNRIYVPDPAIDHSRIEIYRPSTVAPTRPTTTKRPFSVETTYKTATRIVHLHYPPFTKPTTTLPPEEKDDVTIVTALMDIGRGDWDRYRRPLEQYHLYMENLLSLQNNMVIFTDTSSYDFIHKYRKNMGEMHRTKIHLITFNDLPLYRHLDAASKIIQEERQNDRLWRSIWDPAMKDHPEARSAEYDVLVNSKTYFLYNASLEDPFSTEFFVWIDAGYGHGNQSVFPFNNKWKPRLPRNKISLIKLTPVHDLISGYTIDSLYRRNWSVVSGGFVAGDKRSIGQLHTLVHRKFIELTYRNKVDDDQTTLVLVINQYPQLFSITHGGWFDGFHLFGPDEFQY